MHLRLFGLLEAVLKDRHPAHDPDLSDALTRASAAGCGDNTADDGGRAEDFLQPALFGQLVIGELLFVGVAAPAVISGIDLCVEVRVVLVQRVDKHEVALADIGEAQHHRIFVGRELLDLVLALLDFEIVSKGDGREVFCESQLSYPTHFLNVFCIELFSHFQKIVRDFVVEALEGLAVSLGLFVDDGIGLAFVALVEPLFSARVHGDEVDLEVLSVGLVDGPADPQIDDMRYGNDAHGAPIAGHLERLFQAHG